MSSEYWIKVPEVDGMSRYRLTAILNTSYALLTGSALGCPVSGFWCSGDADFVLFVGDRF
ncbi:hypothetical protein DPMN_110023 [Dreissena polymorpha]|uniref:Uncharacterized protein n=1 Tax=Dreissena polymorpha TaxID=45954 RepID=A0A9D4KC65_DREPO|nr:hypothetical protein DPMN_110023 [Dreissena polymorpha]